MIEHLQMIIDNWQLITGSLGTIATGIFGVLTVINKIAPDVVSDTFIGRLAEKTNKISLGTKVIKVKKDE